MMNARKAISLLTVAVLAAAVLTVWLASPARGQSGDFIITNADAVAKVGLGGSSDLNTLIQQVAPRFVVEYANGIRYYTVGPTPVNLKTLLQQVLDRPVIQCANAAHLYVFAYPQHISGDSAPPVITEFGATPTGADSVSVVWWTDELASTIFEYGPLGEGYLQTTTDPLYLKRHEITLTGLPVGQIYHCRMTHTDRNNNAGQSAEYTLVLLSPSPTATATATAAPTSTPVF
jgi:hypothetical protein